MICLHFPSNGRTVSPIVLEYMAAVDVTSLLDGMDGGSLELTDAEGSGCSLVEP